jgi:hypothetical protein
MVELHKRSTDMRARGEEDCAVECPMSARRQLNEMSAVDICTSDTREFRQKRKILFVKQENVVSRETDLVRTRV